MQGGMQIKYPKLDAAHTVLHPIQQPGAAGPETTK